MSDSQIKIEYLLNSSEFNKNMASMKKNMQLCNEEVKNSAKEMNTYGSNIQTLTSRQKAIQQAMEQSKKIMAEYNSNLEKNKKALEGNKQSLEDLSKAKKQANNEYKNAVKMYGEESEEALKLKEALDEVSDEYANMKSRVKGNEDTIVSNTAQLEKQRGVLIDLEGQLKATNKALEEQSNKFISASKRFSEWGQNLEKIGGSLKNLGEDVIIYSYIPITVKHQGDIFGELALQNPNSKRTATIICMEECIFGILSRESYNNIIKDIQYHLLFIQSKYEYEFYNSFMAEFI